MPLGVQFEFPKIYLFLAEGFISAKNTIEHCSYKKMNIKIGLQLKAERNEHILVK